MLKNYFLIAWRNLLRYRVYSAINVAGLAIGMAVVMLIGLWVWDELSYNRQFPHYDRVVRIRINQTHGNDTRTNSTVPIPLIRDMKARYGGDFSQVALGSWSYDHVIAVGDKQLLMAGMFAEPGLTEILSLRTIDGRKASLDDPASLLITESMAKALYGDVSAATGKTLTFDDSSVFQVGALFRICPTVPISGASIILCPGSTSSGCPGSPVRRAIGALIPSRVSGCCSRMPISPACRTRCWAS